MECFYGKRVFVLGNGISGVGAKTALKECGAVICDNLSDDLDLIVVSPGVPTDNEIFGFAEYNKIRIIGELELGYELCHSPVIAVTGTNGKTTVTSLIGDILREGGYKPLVCGNIGVSFSAAAIKESYDIAVTEVSSFQLETIDKFKPFIAIITNITPDHLDRHKTFERYVEIKKKITVNQTESDYLIVPKELIYPTLASLITFGEDADCRAEKDGIYLFDKKLVSAEDIKPRGRHNLLNIMCAASACTLAGVGEEAIGRALKNYSLPPHRIEFIAEKKGVKFFDDSKGTNIGAVLCAAQAMSGDTCLILCGSDKGYEFDELFVKLPDNVKGAVTFGCIAPKIVAAARRTCFKGEVVRVNNMSEAVKAAFESGAQNVLLSPATASFDMYSGYAQRGEDFAREVEKL